MNKKKELEILMSIRAVRTIMSIRTIMSQTYYQMMHPIMNFLIFKVKKMYLKKIYLQNLQQYLVLMMILMNNSKSYQQINSKIKIIKLSNLKSNNNNKKKKQHPSTSFQNKKVYKRKHLKKQKQTLHQMISRLLKTNHRIIKLLWKLKISNKKYNQTI